MSDLNFKSCYAVPDVLMCPQTKLNGTNYYGYCLIYVDDILYFSDSSRGIMECLSKLFRFEEGSMKEPDRYLGANTKKHLSKDRRIVWYMFGKDCVHNSARLVEKEKERRQRYDKKTKSQSTNACIIL